MASFFGGTFLIQPEETIRIIVRLNRYHAVANVPDKPLARGAAHRRS